MKNKIKYLSKNVALFFVSSFLPKILSFFLIPLYTYYLTTEDYGTYDLIITTSSLMIPIFSLCIQDAVMRYAMEKNEGKEYVFSTALNINLIGMVIVFLLCLLLYSFNVFNFPIKFYFFIIAFYFLGSINNMFDFFCKAIGKVKEIVISSCIKTTLTLLLNIFFIACLKLELMGLLYAYLFGLIFSVVYLFFKVDLYKYITLKNNKKLTKKMIKFSAPLIFSSVAWWINSSSDRYILTWIAGAAVNGIYSISYKIPSIISTFATVFNNAWSISSIKDYDKDDSDGFFGFTYTIMNLFLIILCSSLMILNLPISNFFYSKDFNLAWMYIPPLLLSVLYNSLLLFITGVFRAIKDTKTITISVILGAIINTILNFILIKKFGAYGAAIATMIGYLVSLSFAKFKLKKYIILKTNNFNNYFSYIILTFQMILAYFGNKYIIAQFLCLFVILFIYKKSIGDAYLFIMNKIKHISKKRNSKIYFL